MGRPADIMKKTYCEHGFPPLVCNSCAVRAPCVHGMSRDCLLCGMQGSDSWFDKASVGVAKSSPQGFTLPVIVAESSRKPGFNADGTVANDMKSGDYTKAQIESLGVVFKELSAWDLDKVSAQTLFSAMRTMSTELFARGDLEDNIKKMIDRFQSNTGETYSDPSLTKAVREHESTKRFVEQIRKGLSIAISKRKGDIGKLVKKDITLHGRPVFNTNSDTVNGLTIAINDTWAYTVAITSYALSGSYYNGNFNVTLYDHFGLDQPDVEKKFKYLGGFRAWFILQHLDRFAYKPFITKVEMSYSFEGSIQ